MSQPIPLSRLRSPVLSRFLTEEDQPESPQGLDDVFPHSASFDDSPDAIKTPWKRSLYELLELPTSSPSAFLVHVASTFLIVFSALVTVLETVPSFHSISPRVWFGFETSLVALFTVEYVARCIAWSSTWWGLVKWVISFYGVIDILAILPYYIEIILQQDTSVLFRFSILRMFRLLRVFRPFRYNNTILLTIEVMYISIRRSQHALLALSFFVAMMLTVFSTLLYFAERGTWDNTLETFINSDGDPSQFASIPAAAWFVLVTITTVGYGEITPRSFLGRLITVPLLALGLLLIALPSFVLGREFSLVWDKMAGDHDLPLDLDTPAMSFTGQHRRLESQSDIGRDLTNRKLAQNQTELSRQISELRMTIDMQSEMIKDLIGALDSDVSRGKRKERTSSIGTRNSLS
ncbi:hypothetical protein SERLA73DRAFT_188986 [Serpula lacrymans var. lacrymans S7.3]|uniref:Ion transport domain-containing protein n=2 Tax=Serpula lacrymans var. lacrymans TaxID=341189 RepID=F8QCK3_SERL3|nr:uncharacterized protein SERLADRAFT_479620 [Serpula lacrymans var. lacrymans S7.9]EGN93868.1 hypothetical protein SERLA73DRAFT_188986 [Serpula lacrymans var. lacrymans S7.3]EGO19236.1 hypothetical protein SERLADRAFT_479620 [Serpula lacrymans var. lacrymans S7.9]